MSTMENNADNFKVNNLMVKMLNGNKLQESHIHNILYNENKLPGINNKWPGIKLDISSESQEVYLSPCEITPKEDENNNHNYTDASKLTSAIALGANDARFSKLWLGSGGIDINSGSINILNDNNTYKTNESGRIHCEKLVAYTGLYVNSEIENKLTIMNTGDITTLGTQISADNATISCSDINCKGFNCNGDATFDNGVITSYGRIKMTKKDSQYVTTIYGSAEYPGSITMTKNGTRTIYIRSDGALQYTTLKAISDKRLKNFKEYLSEKESLILLKNCKPIKFTWKDSNENTINYGLFAQDLRDILIKNNILNTTLVNISKKDGSDHNNILAQETEDMCYTVDYMALINPLIVGWQNHEKEIQKLKAKNAELETKLNSLLN